MFVDLPLAEVVAMEATTAMMTVVVEVMVAAADMVEEEDAMTTPTVPPATKTVAMDVVMITDPEASTAMLPAVTTATAAVETIDEAGLTTIVVTADVAMAGTLLLREIRTAEVKATMTVTIGTLVVRVRAANLPRYGALLEIMRPHLATKNGFQLPQYSYQGCGVEVLLLMDAGRMLPGSSILGQLAAAHKRSPFEFCHQHVFFQLFGDVSKDSAVSIPVMVSQSNGII
ncbi:MAG: hypothetical protein LQ341_006857 [Variospora aurantia]|nr:MAG: hypothetical protein LQ341_006857 [Variospora aurantia]